MDPNTQIKVRDAARSLAEMLALMPFPQAAEALVEVNDLVNEIRDAHIERLHGLMKTIMEDEAFPTNQKLVETVKKINNMIKMMEGEQV